MHYTYETEKLRNERFAAIVRRVEDDGLIFAASYKAGFDTRSKAYNYARQMAKTLAQRNGLTYTNATTAR